ncbi:MAG TPA: Hsp20/alpha crystallin family protein [Phycisphaerae bacterium]|nr:Hsp20/alpha crystallin family protein [Phycisphaerae bacterium]HOJ73860.1 Hsp20/alpha crystallin family protein [Phycisphaerae bacterium]HOM50801.1 Hsp20/alpha crystallin family protein [Phycisphaerae bacterium]HON69347.1 Hsp20/alpha crystallin family protein [Phycisphaerae bacterium]HOQ88106.1 Hsp20/alpha crystallin family protein [Phycisphaerae bacterium]
MKFKLQASEHSFEAFHQVFGRGQAFRQFYRFSQSANWEPAVNIYTDAKRFYICVELAGLAKEEVTVEVVDREIRIQGERPVPIPCEQLSPECILRMEIDSGRFFRAIQLPPQADLDTTAARLEQGFLWITVDKHNPE